MEFLFILGINVFTQFTKKYIIPKFGDLGVHVCMFALALCITAVQLVLKNDPSFAAIVQQALAYLLGAVAIYEIILKRFGFDKLSM